MNELRTIRPYCIAWIVLTVLICAFCVLANWLALSSFGVNGFMLYELIFPLLIVVSLPTIPFLAVCLIPQSTRRISGLAIMLGSVFWVSMPAGMVLGHLTRKLAIRGFIQRSQPLISAISEYEKINGLPPYNLDSLVPQHFSKVPTTGLGAYSQYKYHWRDGSRISQDNGWWLEIPVSKYPFNWDALVYAAKQKYPYHYREGWFERVGDWAYLHE